MGFELVADLEYEAQPTLFREIIVVWRVVFKDLGLSGRVAVGRAPVPPQAGESAMVYWDEFQNEVYR